MVKIINSPSKYIQGEDEIKNLSKYFEIYGKTGAYILADKFIYDNMKNDIILSFENKSLNHHIEVFGGECSMEEIDRNTEILTEKNMDVMIGIGGGKTLDAAKAIAHYKNIPVIIVPTIASTDAPCSALSVVYKTSGEFDFYLILKENPNVVIMDTRVITNAPSRLLMAGIGDALATYYEAKACHDSDGTCMAGGKISLTGLALAKLCRDTLFEDGLKAKLSVEKKVCTKAVENIIEANTYLSGIGFESGGLAAAHAIHNGLTILEECHHMYHGEKVSFGTIVQLVLENKPLDEIKEVIEFCKSVDLPTNLKDLGIDKVSNERLLEVAKRATAEGETIYNLPFEVNAEMVYAAILSADNISNNI